MTESRSPWADSYASYLEKGLSVIPISPGHKYPGEFDGFNWRAAKGWSKYAEDFVTDDLADAIATWPGAGIGLMPGKLSGVVALDWDYDGDITSEIEAITPPSPVRKVGAKGYTAFYRFNGEVTTRWNGEDGQRVLELLSGGTQTVLPPTIHPDTRKPYFWQTLDTLENADIENLPQLPDDYIEQVTALIEKSKAGRMVAGGSTGGGAEIEPDKLTPFGAEELKRALGYISADDREDWISVGMGLKGAGASLELWDAWSRTSSKYDEAAHKGIVRLWNGFKVLENGRKAGSVFRLAAANGFRAAPDPDLAAIIPLTGSGNLSALMRGEPIQTTTPEQCSEAIPIPKNIRRGNSFDTLEALGQMAPPDWLIKGINISDSLAMTYGASGAGKSFHVLDKALHVAAGKDFHGRKVKKGRVLYIVGEGRTGILKRANAWLKRHGLKQSDVDFRVSRLAVPFLDPNAVNEISELIDAMDVAPLLIIIDTLNRNFGDGDENSTKDMSQFVEAVDRIRVETLACVEVVHHTGKGEGKVARGNSSLRAALDTEVAVVPTEGKPGGMKVTCTKQKDADPFGTIYFDFELVSLGEMEGEPIESLVPILNDKKADQDKAADAIIEAEGKREAKGATVVRQKIVALGHARKRENPSLERVTISRKELRRACIDQGGLTDSNTSKSIKAALENGLVTEIGNDELEIMPRLMDLSTDD